MQVDYLNCIVPNYNFYRFKRKISTKEFIPVNYNVKFFLPGLVVIVPVWYSPFVLILSEASQIKYVDVFVERTNTYDILPRSIAFKISPARSGKMCIILFSLNGSTMRN